MCRLNARKRGLGLKKLQTHENESALEKPNCKA